MGLVDPSIGSTAQKNCIQFRIANFSLAFEHGKVAKYPLSLIIGAPKRVKKIVPKPQIMRFKYVVVVLPTSTDNVSS